MCGHTWSIARRNISSYTSFLSKRVILQPTTYDITAFKMSLTLDDKFHFLGQVEGAEMDRVNEAEIRKFIPGVGSPWCQNWCAYENYWKKLILCSIVEYAEELYTVHVRISPVRLGELLDYCKWYERANSFNSGSKSSSIHDARDHYVYLQHIEDKEFNCVIGEAATEFILDIFPPGSRFPETTQTHWNKMVGVSILEYVIELHSAYVDPGHKTLPLVDYIKTKDRENKLVWFRNQLELPQKN